MIQRTPALFALLAALALTAMPAGADSFRCGVRLVTDGDTTAKVMALCGEPDAVERREVWRRPVTWYRGRPYYTTFDEVPIPVEFWTYNLGPRKLMRRLKFEDGLLVDVETLSHGYHPTRDD